MKALLLSLFLLSAPAIAGTELLNIVSDKTTYTAGENAVLRASLNSRPNNLNFEFDILTTLDSAPLAIEKITDYEYFSTARALTAGPHSWGVQVVVQDARYARDLKSSIASYTDEIAAINADLETETDPDRITALENRLARNISLKASAESELQNIRTPVLTKTLTFSAE